MIEENGKTRMHHLPLDLSAGGWIVSRVDVVERDRTNAVDLDHGLALRRDEVRAVGRHAEEVAATKDLQAGIRDLRSHTHEQRAGQHGHVLSRRVRVRRDLVATRKSEPDRVWLAAERV